MLAGASSDGSGGAASAPAPAPAPVPTPSATAGSMHSHMFGFLSGDALVQTKAMALQLIFPKNRRYENDGLVRAGAFDAGDTGKLESFKTTDAGLNWATSQSIPASTTTGASDRAQTARLLHSAQTIVIDSATGIIKAASDGGENAGSFTPTPTMAASMLKGMIVGLRPHTTRETMTMKRHDYGPWTCVPMNVVNRPTTTILFFEWYYAVGAYADSPRQMMVAEDALSN